MIVERDAMLTGPRILKIATNGGTGLVDGMKRNEVPLAIRKVWDKHPMCWITERGQERFGFRVGDPVVCRCKEINDTGVVTEIRGTVLMVRWSHTFVGAISPDLVEFNCDPTQLVRKL